VSKNGLLVITSRETIKAKKPEGESKQTLLGDRGDREDYVKHLKKMKRMQKEQAILITSLLLHIQSTLQYYQSHH
jgi:hypothetical protein